MRCWPLSLLLLTACPKTAPAPAEQPDPPAVAEPEAAEAAPVLLDTPRDLSLWRVEKDGAVNHFFGTCHLTLDLNELLPPEHQPLLTGSRVYMNEARTDSLTGGEAMRMLWSDDRLYDAIGEDAFRALTLRIGPAMPATMLAHFPAWAAAPLISSAEGAPMDAPNHPVLDVATETLARDSGVDVQALETMEQQVELIAGLNPLFVTSIQESLTRTEPDPATVALGPACLAGDGDEAIRLLSESSGELNQTLLTARNENWVQALTEPLAEGGVFVAVGALHMFGPDGLLAAATEQGYTVTQLQTRVPLSEPTQASLDRVVQSSVLTPAPAYDADALAAWESTLAEQVPGLVCQNPMMACFRGDAATCEADVRGDLRACLLPMAHLLPAPDSDPSGVIQAVAACVGSSPVFAGVVEGTITTGPGCEQAAEVLNAMNQPPG